MEETKDMFIAHIPARPVRPDVIGEVVFVEAWQRFMATDPAFWDDPEKTVLDGVLGCYRKEYSGQREATVCASLICWFGTNCGQGFLMACKRYGKQHTEHQLQDAYLAQWAIENSRKSGINRGIRTLEHCLSTAADNSPHEHLLCPAGPSAEDYECAECLVQWLGTGDGQKFLDYCEAEIDRRRNPIRFPFESAAA
jgi:hypothetical protein